MGNGVNENVDYPVAYVLLNGSSTDIGLKLAKVVEAVMGTAQSGRTATRQGTNGEYYGVLRGANAVGTPGIILEHSFHTNTRATKWLSIDSNLQKLAKAEAECIASYYGVKKKGENTFTEIMGNAVATMEQMTAYIKAKNPDVAQSVIDMIPLYLSEGKAEGVRVILHLHSLVWKQVILDSLVLQLRSTRTTSVHGSDFQWNERKLL